MGIVIGLAVSGAVFRALENDELITKFAAKGNGLSGGEKDTIRQLLSGSDSARQQLTHLASSARAVVDGIVDDAFVHGQRGVMILGVIVCMVGAWTALWGRKRVASEGRIHRVAHGFTLAHWRHQGSEPTASTS